VIAPQPLAFALPSELMATLVPDCEISRTEFPSDDIATPQD